MSGVGIDALSEPLLERDCPLVAAEEIAEHSSQRPRNSETSFQSRRTCSLPARVRFSDNLEEQSACHYTVTVPVTTECSAIEEDADISSDEDSPITIPLKRTNSPLMRQQSLYCGPDTMLREALKKDWVQTLEAMESLDYDNVDNRVFREFGRHQSNVAKCGDWRCRVRHRVR
eukprot:3823373-Pyramimonas_sp.AAC.1